MAGSGQPSRLRRNEKHEDASVSSETPGLSRGSWSESISEGGRFDLEIADLARTVLSFVERRSSVHVLHPVAQHTVDQAS